ncbi:MAG: hypothetical protein ACM3U0_00265 [archaeon]
MKNMLYSTIIVVIFFGCAATGFMIDDDFLSDLASENYRIAGVLNLDVFHKNLETLNYDFYINYLKQSESPSAKGLYKKILTADSYYFKTRKNSFLVLLFYKKDKVIIGDNSQTAFVDTVCKLSSNQNNPDFEGLSRKLHY